MIKSPMEPGWRPRSRWKRKFYASYMKWLERIGYGIALLVVAGFIFAFVYQVDESIRADAVALRPLQTEIGSPVEAAALRQLREDFSEVEKGAIIGELVGSDGKVTELVAPARGTLHWLEISSGNVGADAVVAKIFDYSTIELEANLKGESAIRAAIGQAAKISGLVFPDPDSSVVVRAQEPGGQGNVSRTLRAKEIKAALQKSLEGASLKTRQESGLRITEVRDVQIDFDAKSDPTTGPATGDLDPPPTYSLVGEVISGSHELTAQLSDLPLNAVESATQELTNALKEGRFAFPETTKLVRLSPVSIPKFIVTVKASAPLGEKIAERNIFEATQVERSVRARIRLASPPASLIKRLKEADRNGATITATVEVVTGTKPIALVLIRKS